MRAPFRFADNFIDAAISLGFGHARIILRHMLPNVMASYLIIFMAAVGGVILAEVALSFLGLGVNEPTPAWVSCCRADGRIHDRCTGPPYSLRCHYFAVFGFFVWGDALRTCSTQNCVGGDVDSGPVVRLSVT